MTTELMLKERRKYLNKCFIFKTERVLVIILTHIGIAFLMLSFFCSCSRHSYPSCTSQGTYKLHYTLIHGAVIQKTGSSHIRKPHNQKTRHGSHPNI